MIELYLAANPKTLVIVTSDHGNSGWGINGTGVDYNDATAALHSYGSAKASFEVIIKKMKGRGATEIRELVQEYTGRAISPEEAALLVDAISADYAPYPGDFIYQPDATLGRILSHNAPERRVKGVLQPAVRRGNVGFTSCNHTAEEQLVLAYGHRAREMKLEGLVDNTDLFQAMCRYFGISHRNPAMTPEQAAPFLRVSSREEWQRHAKLHIA